jgi:hypothetical protein
MVSGTPDKLDTLLSGSVFNAITIIATHWVILPTCRSWTCIWSCNVGQLKATERIPSIAKILADTSSMFNNLNWQVGNPREDASTRPDPSTRVPLGYSIRGPQIYRPAYRPISIAVPKDWHRTVAASCLPPPGQPLS